MTNNEDLEVVFTEDAPKSGMWHCGPNNCWVTITHKPTMMQVRVYGEYQYRVRESALTVLEMLLQDFGSEPCSFPENVGGEPDDHI
jgi:protein subunit release factor A